jgi:hypothetical protein
MKLETQALPRASATTTKPSQSREASCERRAAKCDDDRSRTAAACPTASLLAADSVTSFT